MATESHSNSGRSAAASSPPPQRWERFGAAAGFLAAVLLVAQLLTLSSSPSVGASAQQITDYLETNNTLTLVMSYLGAVTAVVLLPFLASLRTFVHRQAEEAEWRWTVTLLSGAVAVAVVVVGSGLRGGAALLAGRDGDAVAVSALFQAAKVCMSFALVPIAAMVTTNSRTMSSARIAVAIRVGPVLGVLGMLAGAVIFIDSNWFGPGEPFVALVGMLLAMWFVATAIAILHRETTTPPG